MSKLNLREKILNAKDIKEEKIFIKEWDVELLIKGMTGKERANFLKASTKNDKVDFESMYPTLVISSTYDPESGEKVFGIADKDIINSKSSAPVEKIAKKVLELSGLDEEAHEEEVKN